QAGDKDDRGRFVMGQGPKFGTQLEAVHAGHLHVEEDQVIGVVGGQLKGHGRVLDVGRSQVGFLQRVGDGAAGEDFVVHHQNVGRRRVTDSRSVGLEELGQEV